MNILGQEYEIDNTSSRMFDKSNYGECDRYTHDIRLNTELIKSDCETPDYMKVYNKIMRHELFHAIFHEAGLDCYGEDETLVDALAILFPKISAIMSEAGVKE